jgi:hypothetical protein
MTLAVVVDHLTERLASRLGADTAVGDADAEPSALPAVTLSLADITTQLAGIGRFPRGTRAGALQVPLQVDLANPVLDLGGGEILLLVPPDRLSLVLPHGPLVRADGTADGAFTAGDLEVRDVGAYAVVDADPTGRQVHVDPEAGTLRFGQPLPATGTLTASYFIGLWDVFVSRFQGRLGVRVTAEPAELSALTRRVADLLATPDPGVRLAPLSWGSTGRPTATGLPDQARVQDLGYRFDAEVEQPLLGSGGGVIADVAVTLRGAENGQVRAESFDIV